ncbi:MAG TPA: F0F1 ATP synthase subunit B [Gammaproteobacteria bacterium]|nr:F0F1 ATP synthase subunit B [Gammaproteobacteria bacterium]
MNINATLLGQAIAFALFVIFCQKYIWLPVIGALRERQKNIADGLAAASRAEGDLELAQKNATAKIKEAKDQASALLAQANKRAGGIVDGAKIEANEERARILASAQAEIEQESNRAREELRASVARLAVEGASTILKREVDEKAHAEILDDLVRQL